MKSKCLFISAFIIANFALAAEALASGDVSILYIVPGIVVYQLFLLVGLLPVRQQPIIRRLRFAAFYLISLLVIWLASEIVGRYIESSGRSPDVFSYGLLLFGPIFSIVIFRSILIKGDTSPRQAVG